MIYYIVLFSGKSIGNDVMVFKLNVGLSHLVQIRFIGITNLSQVEKAFRTGKFYQCCSKNAVANNTYHLKYYNTIL